MSDGGQEVTLPRAMLRTPVEATTDALVELDGSTSRDASGLGLSYVFDVLGNGDATGTVVSSGKEPRCSHRFARPGIYTVRLRVIDASQRDALAVQDIVIRSDAETIDGPCHVASDCVLGDACEHGVCFSVGGAVD